MSRRVAMVAACPYPVPQGSQVLLRDTALAVQRRGHAVWLVVYGYGIGDDPSGLPIYRAANIPGVRRTAAGPSFLKPLLDLALAAALHRVVREQRIDLVHAHNYEGLIVALAARARNRVPRHLRHPVVFAQQRQVLQAVAPRRVQKHQRLHVLARGESARPLLDPYVPIAQAGQAQTAQHPAYGA